jgi:Mannitol dehydrogenase C-terminal domain
MSTAISLEFVFIIRPPLNDVGVSVVSDVTPYETMKLRLLNASHQMMSYLGLLAGHRYVHEVKTDHDLGGFVISYMRDEAATTLAPVPGINVHAYIDQLRQRFSSTTISDTLTRQIVVPGVRIPKFVVPVNPRPVADRRPNRPRCPDLGRVARDIRTPRAHHDQPIQRRAPARGCLIARYSAISPPASDSYPPTSRPRTLCWSSARAGPYAR